MAASGPPPGSMLPSSRLTGISSTSPRAGTDAFSIEAFQAQSHAVIDSEQFYKALRENGNQYGPRFQNVSSIWRAGAQSLGRLSVAGQHERSSHITCTRAAGFDDTVAGALHYGEG